MDLLEQIKQVDLEYKDKLLSLFGLKIGQVIKGYKAWNLLIERDSWEKIRTMFGYERDLLFREESLFSEDQFINNIFGAGIIKGADHSGAGLPSADDINEYESRFGQDYKIAGIIRTEDNWKESLEVWVFYMNAHGEWSTETEVLFSYHFEANYGNEQ